MARREGWVFLIILIILAFCVWVLVPIDSDRFGRKGIQYGIDLGGGVRLVYQVDIPPGTTNEAEIVNDVISVIAARVNPLGVTEPNIERRGNLIIVELPHLSLTDVQKERIGRTALLEFRELIEIKDAEGTVTGQEWIPATALIDGQEKILNSSYFRDNTFVSIEGTAGVLLHFEWNAEGAKIFEIVTTRLLNQPIGIFEGSGEEALPLLGDDGTPIAPVVRSILTDSGVVEGLSIREATELSKQLNAGRLPVPLELTDEDSVEASLAGGLVDLAVRAGIVGVAALMLFMVLYYRVPGVVAVFSLAFYGILTLAIYKLIPVTMTLPGIGGFVISIGMAVDANVLIFERMKEELLVKTTLSAAMESGFSRAWTAIWDSNVTTVLACGILFWVGDSVVLGGAAVKGFALTLGIGVIVSMFTAIVTARTLLRMLVHTGLSKQTVLFTPYTGRKLA